MESLGKFPDSFLAEIAGQPAAIRRAAAGLVAQRETLAAIVAEAAGRTVVLTGMGSSYDACYPLAVALAEAGLAAVMLDAAELVHSRSGILGPQTLVVAVSQSGRSAEVVRLAGVLAAAPGASGLVAVTNGRDNPLAERADFVLDTCAGDEEGPSTMTFAASLVTLAGLGRQWTDRTADIGPEAEAAAVAVDELLARPGLSGELDAWFGDRVAAVVLGRGSSRAAAEMAALTLKEAVGLPVEALQTAQFRHGPLELAGPELAVGVIASGDETGELDRSFAAELAATGAAVLVVGDAVGDAAGVARIDIPRLDPSLSPAVSVVPFQLLSHALARRHGREPGVYVRASKVTIHE